MYFLLSQFSARVMSYKQSVASIVLVKPSEFRCCCCCGLLFIEQSDIGLNHPANQIQSLYFCNRKTYVHRFIVKSTIEEAIYNTISNDKTDLWTSQKFTIESLMALFSTTDIVVTELDQQ